MRKYQHESVLLNPVYEIMMKYHKKKSKKKTSQLMEQQLVEICQTRLKFTMRKSLILNMSLLLCDKSCKDDRSMLHTDQAS